MDMGSSSFMLENDRRSIASLKRNVNFFRITDGDGERIDVESAGMM